MPEQSPDTASLHSRIAAAKRAVDHARSLENVDLISIAMDEMNDLLDQLHSHSQELSA